MAPLLDLARQRVGAERRAFLDDLRRDAPTVTAMIERQLAREAAATVMPHEPAATSVFDAVRTTGPRAVRQDTLLGVALPHVASA